MVFSPEFCSRLLGVVPWLNCCTLGLRVVRQRRRLWWLRLGLRPGRMTGR